MKSTQLNHNIPNSLYPSSLQTTVASSRVQLWSHTGDHTPSLLHISTSCRLLLLESLVTVTLPSVHDDMLPAAEQAKQSITHYHRLTVYIEHDLHNITYYVIYYVIVLLTVAGYDDTCRRKYISINHYLHNKCLLSFSQAIIEDCYISTVNLSTIKHSRYIHRNVIKVGWNKLVIALNTVCPQVVRLTYQLQRHLLSQ